MKKANLTSVYFEAYEKNMFFNHLNKDTGENYVVKVWYSIPNAMLSSSEVAVQEWHSKKQLVELLESESIHLNLHIKIGYMTYFYCHRPTHMRANHALFTMFRDMYPQAKLSQLNEDIRFPVAYDEDTHEVTYITSVGRFVVNVDEKSIRAE